MKGDFADVTVQITSALEKASARSSASCHAGLCPAEFLSLVVTSLATSCAARTRTVAEVSAELITRVREEVGPVASFQRCHVVARLPKTRSGKVLRATMRAIADGRPYEIPATIEDPAALEEIRASLKAR